MGKWVDVRIEVPGLVLNTKPHILIYSKSYKLYVRSKMRLNELKIGESGIIKKIYAKEPLKSKLFALGFARGERVKVLKHTLAKNTFDVDINGVNVALRGEEAAEIEVDNMESGE